MSALRLQRDGSSHKSLGFIIALCAGWFGLQQIFTVFYASGYFYLASLGFSDTLISFTWLSGPIAGMFFQPFVGTLSDKCTHPWGKRRPFIVAGTAMLIASMLSLAWAEEIATAFSGAPVREARAPGGQEEDVLSWELYVFATVCTVAANFSIQPVQLGLRAMIVDLVPSQQQAQAHAWVSKVNLAGSIAGYGIGAVDLRQNLRFLGETQLQILCALVSLNLVVCISITCYLVQEKRPSKLEFEGHRQSARTSALSILGYLRDFPVTRQVCLAQIFCWLAWFPFLFYFAK
jgi:solute carrier family 45 protein 1/2/4